MRLRNGAFVPSAFRRIQKRNLKGFYCWYHHVTWVDYEKTLTLVWEALWLTALSTSFHFPMEHHICLFDSWSIFSHKMAAGFKCHIHNFLSYGQGQKLAWTVREEREVYIRQEGSCWRGTTIVFFTQFLSHSVVSHWFYFKGYVFRTPLLFLLVQLIYYGTNHAKIVGSTPREQMYILNSL